jgi:hypothetical protein
VDLAQQPPDQVGGPIIEKVAEAIEQDLATDMAQPGACRVE